MKIPHHKFPNSIKLYSLSDCHYGNKAFDKSIWKRIINEIKDNDDAYFISVGDVLEMALKDSLSFDFNAMNPENEYFSVCEDLKPIAHKCLGLVSSNHHHRFKKSVGVSVDKLIAHELCIPFLGDIGLIKITCNRASYFVCFHHGMGGGRMKGGKINNLNRLADIYKNCDLYVEGHTHTYMTFQDLSMVVDRKRNKLTEIESTFITGAHMLDYQKSYATRLKYTPAPKGVAFAELKASDNGLQRTKKVTAGLYQ